MATRAPATPLPGAPGRFGGSLATGAWTARAGRKAPRYPLATPNGSDARRDPRLSGRPPRDSAPPRYAVNPRGPGAATKRPTPKRCSRLSPGGGKSDLKNNRRSRRCKRPARARPTCFGHLAGASRTEVRSRGGVLEVDGGEGADGNPAPGCPGRVGGSLATGARTVRAGRKAPRHTDLTPGPSSPGPPPRPSEPPRSR